MGLSRRSALKALVGGAAGLLGLATYGRYIEPGWVQVTSLRVAINGLPRAFHGFRMAFLTDMHLDRDLGTPERLASWLRLAQALEPDAIVFGGDWVTGMVGVQVLEESVSVLARSRAAVDMFTVLGNHDYWTDPHRVQQALERAGVRVLRNAVHIWERRGARLALAGLDDAWSGRPDWAAVVAQLPDRVPALLLLHEPDFVEETRATGRFALQLSGHSHGGQVRFPGYGPLFLPRYGQRYPSGRYDLAGLTLYTSRGLGVSVMRFRLFCPPEVVLVVLERG